MWTIVWKDILDALTSYRFLITTCLLFLLVMVSMIVLSEQYKGDLHSHYVAAAAYEGSDRKMWNPNEPGGIVGYLPIKGIYAFRKPQVLSMIAGGVDGILPNLVHVGTGTNRYRSLSINSDLYRSPLNKLFAVPDYSYIVGIVVSLLCVIFTFDSICGERESNTLRLVMSNPIPRHQVILGKWISSFTCLALAFLVSSICGFIYLYLNEEVRLAGADMSRILLILVVSLIYIALFCSLGLFISSVSKKPASAFVLCLLIWSWVILVYPSLAPEVAALLSPTPTEAEIEYEKGRIFHEYHWIKMRTRQDLWSKGAEQQEIAQRFMELDAGARGRMRKIDEEFENRVGEQVSFCKSLSRVSPYPCFIYSVTGLSRTGMDEIKSFRDLLRRFSDRLQESSSNPDSLDLVPEFGQHNPSLANSLSIMLIDVLLLAIYTVIFFVASYMCFLRYDVR